MLSPWVFFPRLATAIFHEDRSSPGSRSEWFGNSTLASSEAELSWHLISEKNPYRWVSRLTFFTLCPHRCPCFGHSLFPRLANFHMRMNQQLHLPLNPLKRLNIMSGFDSARLALSVPTNASTSRLSAERASRLNAWYFVISHILGPIQSSKRSDDAIGMYYTSSEVPVQVSPSCHQDKDCVKSLRSKDLHERTYESVSQLRSLGLYVNENARYCFLREWNFWSNVKGTIFPNV